MAKGQKRSGREPKKPKADKSKKKGAASAPVLSAPPPRNRPSGGA
jgi:hypothetical protein